MNATIGSKAVNVIKGFNRIALVIAVIAMVLTFNKLCIAEPDSTVRYLMNEPASMFDLGMLKLKRDLDDWLKDPHVNVFVSYDWNTNRIEIKVSDTKDVYKIKKYARNWCDETICEIKRLLDVNCSTGKPLLPKMGSLLYDYFTHAGYVNKGGPKDPGGKLDNIVNITVGTYWGDGKDRKPLRCGVPLLGTEVLCSD
jgi:hypothetical protein